MVLPRIPLSFPHTIRHWYGDTTRYDAIRYHGVLVEFRFFIRFRYAKPKLFIWKPAQHPFWSNPSPSPTLLHSSHTLCCPSTLCRHRQESSLRPSSRLRCPPPVAAPPSLPLLLPALPLLPACQELKNWSKSAQRKFQTSEEKNASRWRSNGGACFKGF